MVELITKATGFDLERYIKAFLVGFAFRIMQIHFENG